MATVTDAGAAQQKETAGVVWPPGCEKYGAGLAFV